MSTVLDTIEVTVEHGGEVLTLDVEITAWPTKGGHEDPPEGAVWRAENGPAFQGYLLARLSAYDAITEQVQAQVNEYCAERAGREW